MKRFNALHIARIPAGLAEGAFEDCHLIVTAEGVQIEGKRAFDDATIRVGVEEGGGAAKAGALARLLGELVWQAGLAER